MGLDDIREPSNEQMGEESADRHVPILVSAQMYRGIFVPLQAFEFKGTMTTTLTQLPFNGSLIDGSGWLCSLQSGCINESLLIDRPYQTTI